MKLSACMLSDCLREQFDLAKEVIRTDERLFDQVLLHGEGTLFNLGKVYIGLGSEFPKKPFFSGHSAIISIGAADECYHKLNCDYFELPDSVLIVNAHNCVQTAFEKFQNWRDQILAIALAGKSIQEILEASLQVFGNPIYLHDSNFRFLAIAESKNLPGPVDVYGIQANSGWLSKYETYMLRTTPGFEKTFETTKATYHLDNGNYNIIYNNIRIGGSFRGRIFVTERARSIRKGDYALLDELTQLIETVYFDRYYIYSGRVREPERQLIKMLEKETVDINALNSGIKELDLGGYNCYYCFQIQLQEIDLSMNMVIRTCELIESELTNCYTFPYKDSIVGIVFARAEDQESSSELKNISPTLEQFSFHAGASLQFRDILSFPKYYEQTSIALKYGRSCKDGQRLHYFEKYSLNYILNCCIENMTPEMLCPPSLQRLIRYDKENNTDFVSTLRVFLENESSPTKAIKVQYIHRSTFMYRLERIREIVGEDLDDNQKRLHLLIVFQLFDLYEGLYGHSD